MTVELKNPDLLEERAFSAENPEGDDSEGGIEEHEDEEEEEGEEDDEEEVAE